jgi:hypothetical protein
MDLQPTRQFDYLQRTLSIFLSNSSDMSEQFELLIEELIKENKQINKSPKNSPESSSSDSKSDLQITSNSPQPLPKKRSAPIVANSKPPPPKRLKPTTTIKNEDEEEIIKKKKSSAEEKPDEDMNEDEDDSDDMKSKSSESQLNPSASRDINEFAIELGLVCNKCMVLTEEKDNRLVECHECHSKYHQKCHKPPVSTADISDPRCLWYCSKCRKMINKRQQSQSSIKETKSNSNPPTSLNKSKTTESTGKKGLPTTITEVAASGLFSFKTKSSDSMTLDSPTSSNQSISSSNSSLTNGTTTKNTNGWASLATGFKEKKSNTEVTSTNSTQSASSILTELSALTSSSNSNNPKRSPSSPKSLNSTSLNPLLKQSINGTNIGSLKSISSSSISLLKSTKPISPPVLKPQLSTSSLKSTQKLLPTSKTFQRVSSPTPLGRQPSVVKSPPTTTTTTATTPAYNRLNSSSSTSSGSSSSSSTTTPKIATGFDYEKRIKQIKKLAAEKSLSKKS